MWRARFAAIGFALLAIAIGFFLGDSYIGRLPNHAGYFLVPVNDVIHVPTPRRPRHTVFILVDGLRRDSAETMTITKTLDEFGQCRISDQGSYTVSRPEYARLSTGLEVDRTGSRNNDLTTPLAAESIWQIARENGLYVSGSSHLAWFKQLFPDGFDRFQTSRSHDDNVFAAFDYAFVDINLFHPLYVDEMAHQHGAASNDYVSAVTRADHEIADLLAKLDFTQDLVIFTADHGHRNEGGHGGEQLEIKNVLICFAGMNVMRRASTPTTRPAFDGRSFAPTLAVLLGLRYPRDMRAGDDGLDVIWDIASPSLGEAYLEDRRAGVEHFRNVNTKTLEGWLGSTPGTWPRFYEREANKQLIRATLIALAMVIFIRIASQHGASSQTRPRSEHPSRSRRARFMAWLAFALLAIWSVHRLILGEFDYTVINLREQFVPRAFAIAFIASFAAVGAHFVLVRSRDDLMRDLRALLGLMLIANLGHIFVYGWPLGFPLPPQPMRYFPFFGAIALVGYGLVVLVVTLIDFRVEPRPVE